MAQALVVGGGVFGISAAISFVSRGWSVELVDAGPIPRTEAASTDISKIVRMDYGLDALSTELMEAAVPTWREWNVRWGEELYHQDGFLVLSRSDLKPGGFEHDSLATLTSRGHTVERLGGGSVGSRYPAWSPSLYPDGYFNPHAGWVESARAVSRMIGDARAAGVRVRERVQVARLLENGAQVAGVVTASGESMRADVVLIAAGAWTPLLAPHLSGVMWPVAQPVFHLKPADPAPWRPPRFTVWAAAIAETGWYGFPANASGLVKIANHGPGRRVHPDDPRVTASGDEEKLREFLRGSLPALADASLAASKTCLYCDSFDGDFFIGRDPDRPGLAVASGDSGHGFKFAPVIGEVIADAIEGKSTRFTERFRWRTPSARKSEDARWGLS